MNIFEFPDMSVKRIYINKRKVSFLTDRSRVSIVPAKPLTTFLLKVEIWG